MILFIEQEHLGSYLVQDDYNKQVEALKHKLSLLNPSQRSLQMRIIFRLLDGAAALPEGLTTLVNIKLPRKQKTWGRPKRKVEMCNPSQFEYLKVDDKRLTRGNLM